MRRKRKILAIIRTIARKKTSITTEALGIGSHKDVKEKERVVNLLCLKRLKILLKIAFASPISYTSLEFVVVFTCFILLTFLRFLIESKAAAEAFPLLYDCKTNLFWKVLFTYTGYILIFATGFSVISYWGMTIRLRLRTKVTRLLHRKLFEKANVKLFK